MTGGVEITRNATKMARGLVSVQSRLNQITDESSSTGKALVAWYEEHGIKAFDEQTGQIRSLYDILTDVSKIWPQLTKNEQSYYLNQQAGANQTQNLAAILSNFQTVIDATSTSLNDSLGSAITENARYMESLEAQTNNLKAEFQDLANNVIDKELVSGALNAANAALEVLNTEVGQTVVQAGLLTGVLTGVVTILGAIIAHLNPIYLAIAGITALGVGLVKLYQHFNEGKKSFDEFDSSIETNTSKLEENKKRIEEINALGWTDKTPEVLAERDALEEDNKKLQEQIDKYNDLSEAKAQAIFGGTEGGVRSSQKTKRGKRGDVRTQSYEDKQYERTQQRIEALTEKLREYQRVLETNHELNNEQIVDYNSIVTEASKYTTAMEHVEGGVASCTAGQQALYNQFQVTKTAYSDAQGYISTYVSGLIEQANKTKTAKDNLYDLAAQMVLTNNQQLNFSQQLAALQQLATQAGITASAIAGVMGTTEVATQRNLAAWMQTVNPATGKNYTKEEAQQKLLSKYWERFKSVNEYQLASAVVSGGDTGTGGGGGGTSKAIKQAEEEAKDAVDEVKDDAQDAVDDVSSSVEDALNEQKSMMQGVIDYYVEYASRKIDEIQEKLDEINDKYDAMLDSAQSKYDAQLEALEAQYNAIEDQYELQQLMDNLAKAKSTYQMVYRNGQFVYEVDQDAVRQAQEALNTYKRKKEYEERKKQLEESLKNETDYIEALRKAETEQLEEEKARWEEYKKGWQDLTSEYEYQQNKLLADQMFGAEQENATWETRLANLQAFVTQYNSLMRSLEGYSGGGGGSSSTSGSGGGGSGSTEGTTIGTWKLNEAYNPLWDEDVDYGELLEEGVRQGYGIDWISGVAGQRNAKIKALGLEGQVEDTQALFDRLKKKYGYNNGYNGSTGKSQPGGSTSTDKTGGVGGTRVDNKTQSDIMRLEDQIEKNSRDWFNASPEEQERLHAENEKLREELKKLNPNGYATGTLSARGGLSLVGEKGAEMRVLNQGDGILPADVTRNLWSFGKNPAGFMQNMGNSNVFNIDNVSLPSVQNAQQFVEGLKNLALQKAYGRT